MKNRLIVIAGPTASGKTETAVKTALAMNGEIVSADSMQVYKDMPVITQTPSEEYRKKIRHYLVEEISPEEEFSAARFAGLAEGYIKDIIAGGKVPVITGGTGLYIKALIDGLFPGPERDAGLRKELEEKASEFGSEALYDELKEKDPESALKIHPNDTKRIIRALEIFYLTGIPKSVHTRDTRGIKDDLDIVWLGIDPPRDVLYDRINRRVDDIFAKGAVAEVEKLLTRKLSLTSRSALGIKEIEGYINGEYDIDEAKELLRKNTRRYAKRQTTWFRPDKRMRWFDDGEGVINYCGSL